MNLLTKYFDLFENKLTGVIVAVVSITLLSYIVFISYWMLNALAQGDVKIQGLNV